jgi:hypothetical protein
MHSETEFLFWEKILFQSAFFSSYKNVASKYNNKNMGKRVKNQNHTCTIHRNTTNSFILLYHLKGAYSK